MNFGIYDDSFCYGQNSYTQQLAQSNLTQPKPSDKKTEEPNKLTKRIIKSCADYDGLRIKIWFGNYQAIEGVLQGTNTDGCYFWTDTNINNNYGSGGYKGLSQRRLLGSAVKYLQSIAYYEFIDDVEYTKLPKPEELHHKRCIITKYDGRQLQGIADCSYNHLRLWNAKNGSTDIKNSPNKFLSKFENYGGISALYQTSTIKVVEGTNEDFNPEDLAPNGKQITFKTQGDSQFDLYDGDQKIASFSLRRCSCCGIAEVAGFEQFYKSICNWVHKDEYIKCFVENFDKVKSLINKQKYGYCVFSVVKENDSYVLFDQLFPSIKYTKNPNSGHYIKSVIVEL